MGDPKKPVAKSKVPAVTRLHPSTLDRTEMQLLGDTDLAALTLGFKKALAIPLIDVLTEVEVERTIDGSSTVTVSVDDNDYTLLRSGRLSAKNDIRIDGLWFRMVKVSKQGTQLQLTFEDREISLLRQYTDRRVAGNLLTSRKGTTRAQFILRMIKEVKEEKIKYYIPELKKVQPIEQTTDNMRMWNNGTTGQRNKGTGAMKNVTIKGVQAQPDQIANINAILDVASSRLVPRKVMVAAITCAIQESSIRNLQEGNPGDYNWLSPDPTRNPVGVFQQIKHWGWPASRDVSKDAAAFIEKCAASNAANPGQSIQALIESVQHSGNMSAYNRSDEADRIVTAYGVPSSTSRNANNSNAWHPANAGGEYHFYRGTPPSQGQKGWLPEDSWTCIKRLAQEVNWRAFFVSGTFYYLSEEELFRSKPMMDLTVDSPGIDNIDFDYDGNKKVAQVTINCRLDRWAAPPGTIIQLHNMGPVNGRWLVSSIRRSMFNSDAEITLKKPDPKLPEPAQDQLQQQSTWSGTGGKDPQAGGAYQGSSADQYRVPGTLVQPIPAQFHATQGVIHETAGLAGYPATDWMCPAGTPVVAPEDGKVIRWSGHPPAMGPVSGVHGPFGWSLYIGETKSGSTYYMTHLGDRSATVGTTVRGGQQVAIVGDYAKWGGADHVHCGVHPGKVTIEMLRAAPEAANPGKAGT